MPFLYNERKKVPNMKIEFLEQIIDRIQHEIHCPKCKNALAKQNIEVSSLQTRRLEFMAKCHVCGASSHVVADIRSGGVDKEPIINGSLIINPKTVQDISSSLASFKGRHVRDLFQ